MTQTHKHWQSVYQMKKTHEVSWYQNRPDMSLNMIKRSGIKKEAAIMDVGGGASTLVDHLMEAGFKKVTVLDISSAALEAAKARLGLEANQVKWIEGDIKKVEFPHAVYDLWHDRALFHFLTHAEDRKNYLGALRHSLRPGGQVILSTFSLDGPLRCSGLDVQRYDAKSLSAELGKGFELAETMTEEHLTPLGTAQKFVYCRFKRREEP